MKLLLCALALAATTAKLDDKSPPQPNLAKITLQTADQDLKDAAIIAWNGTTLHIPQHTQKLDDVYHAIEALQDEIDALGKEVTVNRENHVALKDVVDGLEKQWTAAITSAVADLKVEDVKAIAEEGLENAKDALTKAAAASDDIKVLEDALQVAEDQVEENARDIQQNEDNVAANAEDIAENEQNIGGKACRKGTYHSPTNPAECIRCKRGTYADEVGLLKCKYDTSKGSLATQNGCIPGTFNPYDAATTKEIAECKACKSGRYTDKYALAMCKGTECAKGKWHPNQQSVAHTCKDCAKGKYNDHTGMLSPDACKDCVKGEASNVFAATKKSDCKACAKGKYADSKGLATCKSCGKGKYNTEVRSKTPDSCKDCEPGTYGDQTARTSKSQCKGCASGTYNANEYGRTSACKSCTDTGTCPNGKVKQEGKSCTSKQNQVCVTKWDSWLSSTKCRYAGAAVPCGSAKSKCENEDKCYGIQQRNWQKTQCTPDKYGYKPYSYPCWCWWSWWGGGCHTCYGQTWGVTSKGVCSTTSEEDCNMCTSSGSTLGNKGGYKFLDYNKW